MSLSGTLTAKSRSDSRLIVLNILEYYAVPCQSKAVTGLQAIIVCYGRILTRTHVTALYV